MRHALPSKTGVMYGGGGPRFEGGGGGPPYGGGPRKYGGRGRACHECWPGACDTCMLMLLVHS